MVNPLFDRSLRTRQGLAARLFSSAMASGRLAHAYLLTGRTLNDKWRLARQVAALVNCANKGDRPDFTGTCLSRSVAAHESDEAYDWQDHSQGYCQNCRWIARSEHPQAWIVLAETEKVSGKIPVEKARAIASELLKTSPYVRVVVVPEASEEKFHRPAANALLKTIEEPGLACLFFLFAASEDDVLPTIVSRCQIVPMNVYPAQSEAALIPGVQSEAVRNCLTGFIDDKRAHAGDAHAFMAALTASTRLNEMAQDDIDPGEIIDMALKLSAEKWRAKARENANVTAYLTEFLALCRHSQDEVKRFVNPKAVIESFALSWVKLRNNFNC